MVRLTDHPDMTIHVAVDWDIKSQTKQNQIHYTTQRTYLNEGSTTSFLVNPQEAVITKDSIATGSSKTGCTYVDPIARLCFHLSSRLVRSLSPIVPNANLSQSALAGPKDKSSM